MAAKWRRVPCPHAATVEGVASSRHAVRGIAASAATLARAWHDLSVAIDLHGFVQVERRPAGSEYDDQ